MSRNTGPTRIAYLDGIRAVAIGAVLALHWLSWYVPLFRGGSIGVDLFFVLSGFIITTVLWRQSTSGSAPSAWWTFVKRRFVRLYPALLGFVVLTVVLYTVVPEAPVSGGLVAERGVIVLTQLSAVWLAFSANGIFTPDLNPFGQTWSLALEWYAYLLWPVVVLVARRRGVGARRLMRWTLSAAALSFVISLPLSDAWFYFGPAARFSEILVGGALALFFASGGSPARPGRAASVLASSALVMVGAYTLLAPHASSDLYRFIGVPVTALAAVVLIFVGHGGAGGAAYRLLAHPWVATLGRYSYSLYLWHMVPVLLLQQASPVVSKPLLGLAAAAAALVLTVLSYHLLERPFLRSRSAELRSVGALPSEVTRRTGNPPLEGAPQS